MKVFFQKFFQIQNKNNNNDILRMKGWKDEDTRKKGKMA